MDPQGRKTVEVTEVDIIEGEEGEPGSSTMGTLAGTAAGAVMAGGLAAAAAMGAPAALAAATLGAIVGAVAGGAMGKEVPRGVDGDSAMEYDQPAAIQAGREQETQDALTETVSGSLDQPAPGAAGGGPKREEYHGRPTPGEHEIVDVKGDSQHHKK
ncbi:hypothetical protein CHLRE_06g262150v5 [Chlamydomonas reinhardtii]|nr:uncharacterized protein CHLRE_06g262150v5 [Chlamydomonas reinhardtii]PNW81830.1 hypothetical protein CHLRE_06g262150v5 [Chlamydomonas reinhardtii]